MSAARLSALEARLADVEKRHAEAIARLSLAVYELLIAPEIGTQDVEGCVEKQHMRANELVPEAWDRVFAEWERETGADKGFKPEEGGRVSRLLTFEVALLALAVGVSLVFSIWRICKDVRRIREHLDRVVPDYIRDRRARMREKTAGTEEAGT